VSTYGPAVSAGTSGGLPTLRLADGLPLPVATHPTAPRGTILAVDRDFRSTRVQQFNLTLEKASGANVQVPFARSPPAAGGSSSPAGSSTRSASGRRGCPSP
jgi:hypothetical protein